MNIEDMTPEQIEAYVQGKQARRASLEERYLGIRPVPMDVPQLEPFERAIEVEGVSYPVDMRRFASRTGLRKIAEQQKAAKAREKEADALVRSGMERAAAEDRVNSNADIGSMLGLYDYFFGGKVDDLVVQTVTEAKGYDDFDEIVRIETLLFDAVNQGN